MRTGGSKLKNQTPERAASRGPATFPKSLSSPQTNRVNKRNVASTVSQWPRERWRCYRPGREHKPQLITMGRPCVMFGRLRSCSLIVGSAGHPRCKLRLYLWRSPPRAREREGGESLASGGKGELYFTSNRSIVSIVSTVRAGPEVVWSGGGVDVLRDPLWVNALAGVRRRVLGSWAKRTPRCCEHLERLLR